MHAALLTTVTVFTQAISCASRFKLSLLAGTCAMLGAWQSAQTYDATQPMLPPMIPVTVAAMQIVHNPALSRDIKGLPTPERKPEYIDPQSPEGVVATIDEVMAGDPLAPVMERLIHSESGLNPKAVSPTGARGLVQFTKTTLLEQLYINSDKLPPENQRLVRDNVEKYNAADKGKNPVYKYRVKNKANLQAVLSLAHDPVLSLILGREYMRNGLMTIQKEYPRRLKARIAEMKAAAGEKTTPGFSSRIAAMEAKLDRPLTAVDAKMQLLIGTNGTIRMLVDTADPKRANHRAVDYANKLTVSANMHVFYKDVVVKDSQTGKETTVKSARSVRELHDYFAARVGTTKLASDLRRADAFTVALLDVFVP